MVDLGQVASEETGQGRCASKQRSWKERYLQQLPDSRIPAGYLFRKPYRWLFPPRGCPAAVRVVSAIQLIESRTRVACTVTVQTPAKGDLFLFCLLQWPLRSEEHTSELQSRFDL